MAHLRIPPSCLAILLLTAVGAFPSILAAQEPAFSHERVVPQPAEPAPFSAKAVRQKPLYTVEFRSAETLTDQDRLLIANSESTIAEHAGFAGLEYSEGNWSYRQ